MKKGIFIVLTAIILFSCSSALKVTSEVDETVDFSAFETLEYYGWNEDSQVKVMDFYKLNLEKSFETEFLNRGIKAVKKGEGDIIVSLHIIIKTEIETVAHTSSTNVGKTHYNGAMYGYGGMHGYAGMYGGMYGYGGFYGFGPNYAWGGGHPQSMTTYSEQEYDEGTLIVSVYDAKKKELIWEAAGSKPLTTTLEDLDKAEKQMQETVAEIMKEYPVNPR